MEEEEENKEEEEAEDVLDSELIHLCAHINVNFVRYTKTITQLCSPIRVIVSRGYLSFYV